MGTVLALVCVAICALSLLFLAYVGFGEANRTFPRFVISGGYAQGRILQADVDRFLSSDLPVDQFPGFDSLARTLLAAEPAISDIRLVDASGKVVFSTPPPASFADLGFARSVAAPATDSWTILESAGDYRVVLPVTSRFETVGRIDLDLPKLGVARTIDRSFGAMALVGVGLFLIYCLVAARQAHRPPDRAERTLRLAYGVVYLLSALVLLGSLTGLYSTAIRNETRAIASSLAGRLSPAFEMGLSLADFSGLDRTFSAYLTLDPDLSEVTLTSQGRVMLSTSRSRRVASLWTPSPAALEAAVPVGGGRDLTLHMEVPEKVVYAALWRSLKNFLVLFVATTFLSVLFLGVGRTLALRDQEASGQERQEASIALLRPIYFLGVFVEGLNSAFLPQFFGALARADRISQQLVAPLFTMYFACFLLALLPAGRLAQARGPKPVMIAGALLSGVAMVLMVVAPGFYWLFLARGLAGLGQGALLVGVESTILSVVSAEHRTRGSALIVYGYNGGMISGAAIGALLAVYMGYRAVFGVASVCALVCALYVFVFAPAGSPPQGQRPGTPLSQPGIGSSLKSMLADRRILLPAVLVGLPTKATLTGVTLFAVPLLLARLHLAQEDIGQILMAYAAGVLVASRWSASAVDRTGRSAGILTVGMLGSALGLALLGLTDPVAGLHASWGPLAGVALPIVGLLVLGLSHGMINAPIITHITTAPTSERLGKGLVASLFRFLERFGHVAGPILVAQLLVLGGRSSLVIVWIGGAIATLAGIFALTSWRVESSGARVA